MDVERSSRLDGIIPGAGGRLQRRRAGNKGAAVLIDHIVGRERDEYRRTHAKAVPQTWKRRAVVRQRISREIRIESLRTVIELNLVIARTGHPRTPRSRELSVLPKVSPHSRLRRRV